MPDNKSYQQELADRGWAQMRRILDVEMPQRRNRRFFWIWLAAASVVIATSVLLLHTTSDSGQQPNNDPSRSLMPVASEQPVAQSESEGDHSDSEVMPSSDAIASNMEAEGTGDATEAGTVETGGSIGGVTAAATVTKGTRKNDLSDAQVDEGLRVEHEALPRDITKTDSRDTDQVPGSVVAAGEAEKEQESARDQDPKDQGVEIGKSGQAEMIVVSPDTDKTLQDATRAEEIESTQSSDVPDTRDAVSVIDLVSSDPLVDAGSFEDPSIDVAQASDDAKFGLHPLSRLHMNGEGEPLYGIETGVATIFRADKRVQVHSGLTYGYYTQSGLGDGHPDETIDLNNPGSGPLTGVMFDVEEVRNNRIGYDSARLLTEEFHYIQVPLNLAYKVTPRLALWAGAKAAILVGAPAKYGLSDAVFQGTNATSGGSRSFLYDYGILRKVDVSPEFGVSWQATQALWIDAGYKYGLVPYINRSDVPDRSDYHRTISLGLRLRIL